MLGSSHILAQDIPFCGPEKEGCVKSQPLKDSSCLVPCHGLYADIADDSGMLGVIKGMSSCYDCIYLIHHRGLHMITQDLNPGVQTRLYKMFPTSAHERDAHVKMMTERYLNYKMEYVKHLAFNPEEQNFSKFFSEVQITSFWFILFCSHFDRACTA